MHHSHKIFILSCIEVILRSKYIIITSDRPHGSMKHKNTNTPKRKRNNCGISMCMYMIYNDTNASTSVLVYTTNSHYVCRYNSLEKSALPLYNAGFYIFFPKLNELYFVYYVWLSKTVIVIN